VEEIVDYIFKLSKEESIVFVLDEYPYLRENVKGLDSIIQALVDKYREDSKLKLIVLGSYVEVMKSLLKESNPLYGRTDLVIDLKQMDYYESALFYPNMACEDKVRIYSVFGGVPYYNRLVDDKKSVKENVIELVASPGARLENEVSTCLNAEISKIVNANEVFDALARGFSKYSDILSQSHVSSSPTLADVLDKLMKMEVVEMNKMKKQIQQNMIQGKKREKKMKTMMKKKTKTRIKKKKIPNKKKHMMMYIKKPTMKMKRTSMRTKVTKMRTKKKMKKTTIQIQKK
jgi:AAA+ ATPase superfamily predicted ATPase